MTTLVSPALNSFDNRSQRDYISTMGVANRVLNSDPNRRLLQIIHPRGNHLSPLPQASHVARAFRTMTKVTKEMLLAITVTIVLLVALVLFLLAVQ